MKRIMLAAMAVAAVSFAVACGGNTAAPKGNQPAAAAARPETPARASTSHADVAERAAVRAAMTTSGPREAGRSGFGTIIVRGRCRM